MRAAAFRVGGRIVATLAFQDQGYGNLMLKLEQQAASSANCRMFSYRFGVATHLRLAKATEDVLRSALLTADHSGNMHIVEAVQLDALPKSLTPATLDLKL